MVSELPLLVFSDGLALHLKQAFIFDSALLTSVDVRIRDAFSHPLLIRMCIMHAQVGL